MHHLHFILAAKSKDETLQEFAKRTESSGTYLDRFNFSENNWTFVSFVENVQTGEAFATDDFYGVEKLFHEKYKDKPIPELPFEVHEDSLYRIILARFYERQSVSYKDFAAQVIESIEENEHLGFSWENLCIFQQAVEDFKLSYDAKRVILPEFNTWNVHNSGLSNVLTKKEIEDLSEDKELVLVGLDIHT